MADELDSEIAALRAELESLRRGSFTEELLSPSGAWEDIKGTPSRMVSGVKTVLGNAPEIARHLDPGRILAEMGTPQGEASRERVMSVAGPMGSAMAGGYAGLKGGAALGALGGPFGAAAGGLLGGAVGAVGGSSLYDYLVGGEGPSGGQAGAQLRQELIENIMAPGVSKALGKAVDTAGYALRSGKPKASRLDYAELAHRDALSQELGFPSSGSPKAKLEAEELRGALEVIDEAGIMEKIPELKVDEFDKTLRAVDTSDPVSSAAAYRRLQDEVGAYKTKSIKKLETLIEQADELGKGVKLSSPDIDIDKTLKTIEQRGLTSGLEGEADAMLERVFSLQDDINKRGGVSLSEARDMYQNVLHLRRQLADFDATKGARAVDNPSAYANVEADLKVLGDYSNALKKAIAEKTDSIFQEAGRPELKGQYAKLSNAVHKLIPAERALDKFSMATNRARSAVDPMSLTAGQGVGATFGPGGGSFYGVTLPYSKERARLGVSARPGTAVNRIWKAKQYLPKYKPTPPPPPMRFTPNAPTANILGIGAVEADRQRELAEALNRRR